MKQCSKCKRVLKKSEFYRHVDHRDGLRSECKTCTGERNRIHYHDVVKTDSERMDNRRRYGCKWYRKNAREINIRINRNHKKQRKACIAEYGGVCECCGEARFEFLALHHRNGDGYEHRKQIGGKVARWLVQNDFPKDIGIGILCHNCNAALGYYGYCPHEREVEKEAL